MTYPSLDRDLSVDVAIVGGGLTGLTAAWQLRRAGRRVAVLEAFPVAATGSTSAGVTSCLDTEYRTLASRLGEESARVAAEASAFAIDFIQDTIGCLGVDCAFQRVAGYRYAESESDVAGLEREAETAARLGLAATFVRAVPLPFPVAGAVRFERQAQLDTVAYLGALARAVDGEGGCVFGGTRVVAVEDGVPCRLSAGGHVVSAGTVIEATYTPLGRVLSLQTRLEPRLSYELEVSVDAPPRGLFWDSGGPHHHLRGHGDRLLVGGLDHRTGTAPPREPLAELEAYARARFDVRAVARGGSWPLFAPADGLPCIGKLPGAERIFVASGYGRSGVTFGTVAGVLLAELVAGESSEWSQVFSPARVKPVAAAKHPERAHGSGWAWVADRLRGRDAGLIADVPEGGGRVVEIDGNRAAVYRDRGRELHFLSPVCTHAGCIVAWNPTERTWDCPCHGSRYDPLGRVLSAPATEDLEGS